MVNGGWRGRGEKRRTAEVGDSRPSECITGATLGWNPASNSEGREGFVVREVQGRRGPLNWSLRTRCTTSVFKT